MAPPAAASSSSSSWAAASGHARPPLASELWWAAKGRLVPKFDPADFSYQLFQANFSHKRPFVLQGVASGWPAATAWSWENFTDQNGRYAAFRKSMGAALEGHFPDPNDNAAEQTNDTLFLEDLLHWQPFSTDCPYAAITDQEGGQGGLLGGNFLPRLLDAWKQAKQQAVASGRLDAGTKAEPTIHTYFIAGHAGSGGNLHIDPEGTAYWNAVVHGRKRWMFLRKEELKALAAAIAGAGPEVTSEVALLAGVRARPRAFPSVVRRLLQSISAVRWFGALLPMLARAGIEFDSEEVVVEPGELIYGPPGVFHVVLALEDSVGCSEQMVDAGNLAAFVRNKQEDYRATDAFLACTAAQTHWPELLGDLSGFCDRADKDLARAARQLQQQRSQRRGQRKTTGDEL